MKIIPITAAVALSALMSTSLALADMTQIRNRFGGQLSDGLTSRQKEVVLRDFDSLSRMRIFGTSNGWFSAIFGGTSSAAVLNYLDERINYVFSPNEQLPILARQLSIDRNYDGGQWHVMSGGNPFANPSIRQFAVAANLSLPFWFNQIQNSGRHIGLLFNNQPIQVLSTRVGVIALGEIYFNQNSAVAEFRRMSTLIHEARHSDCKNGLSTSDHQRVANGQRPLDKTCSYSHDNCPESIQLPNGEVMPHPYASKPACDSMAWGATAVQLVFAIELRDHCSNCSESIRQQALMVAADGLNRNSNGIGAIHQMLAGQLGQPDMSSSNRTR